MKKFSLILLCATALTLGVADVYAKDNAPEPQKLEQHIDNMKKHHEKMENKLTDTLKLTDEQREQSKKLREESRKKIKPLMDEMKEIRKKMDDIRKENMEAFEDILTPEQKAEFDKHKAERKEHYKKFKKHGPKILPPMPME